MRDGPQIFLSYARADQLLAQDVADSLLRDGIRVWTDRQVAPGRPWADEIDRAVRASTAFVVLMTPQLTESQHSMAELGFVMSEQRDSGKPLVSVQVGTGNPLLSSEHFAVVDGRGLEPREIAERVRCEVARTLRSISLPHEQPRHA